MITPVDYVLLWFATGLLACFTHMRAERARGWIPAYYNDRDKSLCVLLILFGPVSFIMLLPMIHGNRLHAFLTKER